jgi:replicative DNA helicase
MGAPTEIVVTEWSPYEVNSSGRKGMFRIIGRFEIERSDFTLTNAVDKIIEINQAFNPDYIYVDRGYGETQVELLHKYGVDHPESGLGRKVKAITFQGKIPVKDPFTGETDDKHVKPFLVNNSIHILDSDLLQLNDEDTLLWRQMENYQVVGVSTYGLPTYSKKDEHALDAMNLSLLAMTLEFPELSKLITKFHKTNKVISIARKERPLIQKVNPSGGIETDPVELRDEKYKNCRKQKSLMAGRLNPMRRNVSKGITGRKTF